MTGKQEVLRRPGAPGFSLIEVVIAIAVIGVTFIGIIGLLGLGIANDQISSQQTMANNIAASILADLRSTPTYAGTPPPSYTATAIKSTRFKLTLPTSNSGTTAAPFSGINPTYYLYFDNLANWLPIGSSTAYTSVQTTAPSGSAFMAAVYLAQIGSVGPTTKPQSLQINDMARIVIIWPALPSAQITAGSPPAGSVDVISQFLLH
jgi:type II secretory pathway pseudopilin PulG